MPYVIDKYHGNYNIVARKEDVKYIVVHYVGAGTSDICNARNNCIYFSGGNRMASAHYFIDDGSIYEYADPKKYYTWHVGDGNGKYGVTNSNSIGIEVCMSGNKPFTEEEIKRLTWLVQKLMKEFGVPASNVVRHYDASRKMCPEYYVRNSDEWHKLHSCITANKDFANFAVLKVDGLWGFETTKAIQKALGTSQDGMVSGQNAGDIAVCNRGGLESSSWKLGTGGSMMVRAIQKKIGATVDGYFGKNTCKALQKYLGTVQDGTVSAPSNMVMEMQRRLNDGKF